MAELIRSEYLCGSNGEVAIIKLDNGRFLVQWGAYIDNGEYCDSGYSKATFATIEEAEDYFEHNYNWR